MIPTDKYKIVLTNRSQTIRGVIIKENNGCIGEFTIDVSKKKSKHYVEWVESYFGHEITVNRILSKYEQTIISLAHELRYGCIKIDEDNTLILSYKKATDTEFEELIILVEV